MKFLLILLIIGFIIYRLVPFLLKWFVVHKANQFTQNAQNRSRQQSARQGSSNQANTDATYTNNSDEEKVFSKDEGEYVKFEEIKDDK